MLFGLRYLASAMWINLLPVLVVVIINAANSAGAHMPGFRMILEYYDPSDCEDTNQYCADWASKGECAKNPGYMLVNCRKSCNNCSNTPANSTSGNAGRPGSATNTHSCEHIRAVPSHLRSARNMYPKGLGSFYQKYTEVYGIPVLGSNALSNSALQRACYTARFLLADVYAVRNSYYKKYGRFALMGIHENTTDIPEHTSLGPWWNTRARGLGATESRPVSTGGEENALCKSADPYRNEDILLHEFSHGVHLLGARFAFNNFDSRLKSLYNSTKYEGSWTNTYAMSTDHEYFAEGVQSYFGANAHSNTPNGVHGPISTRAKLRSYDPALYNLIREVFPCGNTYIKRCQKDRKAELSQKLQTNCARCGEGGGGGGDGGGGGAGGGDGCGRGGVHPTIVTPHYTNITGRNGSIGNGSFLSFFCLLVTQITGHSTRGL